ncbi:MAG: PorP/SprF family type IX secretion system membrane protein [Flavobacteriaceae bacterium]|nr:PorP/SprF family type IX secretion system membrane protein [Flavobacteriaceae bacterium]
MKSPLLISILFTSVLQATYSQQDNGVVALNLPTRNSITFNRFETQPTFSFVRESSKYFSIYAKREALTFDNAPETYLVSYSGRFKENIGAGLALFQQNYGVLTTFGGIFNLAYNLRTGVENNLTFGLNIGAYKSGLNSGDVITNHDDSSLQNITYQSITTVSPALNYGFAFLDIGLGINNLITYSFKSSALIKSNPEQAIQVHLMYTGYMRSRGFLDDSKFSGLAKVELKNEDTIYSGSAMLTVPAGFWTQVGYNSFYGASAGLGLNITKNIAIAYNYDIPFGDLTEIGTAHTLTLAYRFKNNERYKYTPEDDRYGLIEKKKRSKYLVSRTKKEAKEKIKKLAELKTKKDLDATQNKTNETILKDLAQQAQADKITQDKLIEQLEAIVISKTKDFTDLKAEIDRDTQKLNVKLKPFKSTSNETKNRVQIIDNLNKTIRKRNTKIKQIEELFYNLYESDTLYNNEVILYYKTILNRLKSEQIQTVDTRTELEHRLSEIKIATDYERRRRIERAKFKNEDESYKQGRLTLEHLKKTTILRNEPVSVDEFDTGEPQNSNIQILNNIKHTETGIYVVLAVHTDPSKRDDFLTKAIASGATNIDFFYDVKTSKYYIYIAKYDSISDANNAIKLKNKKPYNKNISLVKIEN